MKAVGTNTRAERFEQHAVQVGAMDRELRPVVAGVAAGRLAVDELPVAVVEGRFAGGNGDPRERLLQAERAHLARGVRQQVHAHAHRLDLRGGLVNARRNTRAMQHERESQAADAGADDGHFHLAPPSERVMSSAARRTASFMRPTARLSKRWRGPVSVSAPASAPPGRKAGQEMPATSLRYRPSETAATSRRTSSKRLPFAPENACSSVEVGPLSSSSRSPSRKIASRTLCEDSTRQRQTRCSPSSTQNEALSRSSAARRSSAGRTKSMRWKVR